VQQKATQITPVLFKAIVVTGGLYAAQMTFSGSCSSIAHLSGAIKATIEDGGVLRTDGGSSMEKPDASHSDKPSVFSTKLITVIYTCSASQNYSYFII
jgi:hypothetical protein